LTLPPRNSGLKSCDSIPQRKLWPDLTAFPGSADLFAPLAQGYRFKELAGILNFFQGGAMEKMKRKFLNTDEKVVFCRGSRNASPTVY
jgi:hypothetical protein